MDGSSLGERYAWEIDLCQVARGLRIDAGLTALC